MDKTTVAASPSNEGLPSMQMDGRRLLADPESRDWDEHVSAGRQQLESQLRLHAQVHNMALASLLSLLLVALKYLLLPDLLPHAWGVQWLLAVLLFSLFGVAARAAATHFAISPLRIFRWQFATSLWGLCMALLWGGAFGYLLQQPWQEDVALAMVVSALAGGVSLMVMAHWFPALLLCWGGWVGGQVLVGAIAVETLQVPVLGFDLLLLALGMMLAMSIANAARQTVAERTSRRELAEIKARLSDQQERLSHEEDERHDIESALREARGAADMAVRAKTEFLATMSHEIRTPLNGVLPVLEILRESDLDDDQRQFLDTAYNSSRHLLRIINDVLDFSRAESGKLELENIEINLRDLVESITDLMGKGAERRGLKLNYRVGEDVPHQVRGDPLRLRQILTNLISNAIKFTEEGEIQVEVQKRRASRKEVELVFTVRDTGAGMSRDTQRRLFRAFAQADASTTRKHGGTGLGLVICKRLVELMGGRIGVKSQLGEGSSFWFALPMRKSSSDVPPARKDLAGLRVMTLVDDPAMAAKLSEVLSDWRMTEEKASSGVAAMTRLQSSGQLGRSWGFELLLIVHSGSKQSLVSLLQDIRQSAELEDLKIGVVTSSSSLHDELSKQAGVFVVETPINYQVLQRQLHRLFDVEGQRIKSDEDTEALFDSLALDFDPEVESAVPQHPVVRGPSVARALVVEDNPVNLSVARRMLAKLGIDTLVARNGHQALDALAHQRVDLVLMDCQMPSMDGYEATRRLRALEEGVDPPRHLPVVAMTANAMTDDRGKCLEAGMDDYLSKPLDFASLRRALEPWLHLRDGRHHSKGVSFDTRSLQGKPAFEVGDVASLRDEGLQAATAQPPLDEKRLVELQALMEEELPGLIRDFLTSSKKLLEELDEASETGRLADMLRPAHSLKSSSANLCAMRLSNLAERLEKAAGEGKSETAGKLYRKLAREHRRVVAALRSRLG